MVKLSVGSDNMGLAGILRFFEATFSHIPASYIRSRTEHKNDIYYKYRRTKYFIIQHFFMHTPNPTAQATQWNPPSFCVIRLMCVALLSVVLPFVFTLRYVLRGLNADEHNHFYSLATDKASFKHNFV